MIRFLLYAAAFMLSLVAMFVVSGCVVYLLGAREPQSPLSGLVFLLSLVAGLWVGACVYDRLVTAWTAPKTERPWR